MLEVQGLEVSYGAIRVIDGVHLSVAPGEIVALLGTNGAGKSTVLKAVSGIIPIGAGRITFNGQEPRTTPVASNNLGMGPS